MTNRDWVTFDDDEGVQHRGYIVSSVRQHAPKAEPRVVVKVPGPESEDHWSVAISKIHARPQENE